MTSTSTGTGTGAEAATGAGDATGTGAATGAGGTEPPDGHTRGTRPREWARDLAMGARFATSGGRQGWLRTLLTAVGVALGVAVLLLAAAVPEMIAGYDAREEARSGAYLTLPQDVPPSADSVLSKDANNRYGGGELFGRLLQADGATPATPPGVEKVPAPGEMLVSPALAELLRSPAGEHLAERLDGRVVGTIGEEGLLGPGELAFYKGADDLSTETGAVRVTDFSSPKENAPLEPALLLLVVVACAVLVMPVAVFVATAVRFGGEQRDARLAALRLVGADVATSRRIAAGESLVGALLGLLLGGWFFLLGRAFIGRVELFGFSVFPVDVAPSLGLGLLIVLGVPVSAVAVTIVALRGVAIEPLGLVRRSEERSRRLWWRLLPPAGGAALLYPLAGSVEGADASVSEVQVIAGVVLLLVGVALLLPWLVERVVGRLRGGPVSWQLAVRRLQLSSGNASRAVSGITIAVAGAIALQMLFAAVETGQTEQRHDVDNTGAVIYGPSSTLALTESLTRELNSTPGVRRAQGRLSSYAEVKGSDNGVLISMGDCSTLRRMARVGACKDGDIFLSRGGDEASAPLPGPGARLVLDEQDAGKDTWTIPASTRTVEGIPDPEGRKPEGLLITPGALSEKRLPSPGYQGWVRTEGTPEALEQLRTTIFRADPSYSVFEVEDQVVTAEFATLRRAVLAAAVGVLALIGASMIVSMLEQLRDRKRQLSVLVAFGTKRSTLGASVLWQTAVPVVLGIGLAVVFGLGLGWGLLRLLGGPAADWLVFLPMAGAGAAVIAVVTLVSLPFLWRMMRPDGLRTE